jgi:hypothetical protein
VDEQFLSSDDPAVGYPQTRLRERLVPGVSLPEIYALYRRLLSGEEPALVADSGAQMALRLCGLGAPQRHQGRLHLCARNRVFTTAYDEKWLEAREAERPFFEPMQKWLKSGRRDDFVLRGEALAEAEA